MEVVVVAIYVGAALGAALGLALLLGVLLHAQRDYGQWLQVLLIPWIVGAITVGSLLSNRNLRSIEFALSQAVEPAQGGGVLRIFTMMLVGACFARIGAHFFRPKLDRIKMDVVPFLAFAFVFLTHHVLASIWGTKPAFIYQLMYPIVVFGALYLAQNEPVEPVLHAAKLGLHAMMLLSLLLAVVWPTLTVQYGYHGFLPGISFRLWGVGSNPNSIGPLAWIALLFEYLYPTRSRWLRIIAIGAGVLVFVLAQSKTAWGIAVLLTPVLIAYRMPQREQGVDVRWLLLAVFGASAGLLGLLFTDPVAIWERFAYSSSGSELTSLTGRDQIWEVAIQEWLRNPIFGYGPTLWNAEFRQQIGMLFAFSAHNQFLQSLSMAGILGLVSMVVYLVVLGRYAWRAGAQSRGVSMVLYLTILIRSLTETPMSMGTLLSGEVMTQILLFMLCLHWGRAPVEAQPGEVNGVPQREQ
ncbi:O-antigen ligase family protein [Candidatus Symbiobacter mobilis]|uniref:O-antigen polymerase n=1 Tax=Candidatus Symbiobacter mobilis CR TaxID=946483 RepID=U5NBA6_9BURK|nr:O-antigen ligase family protein [Candidatus Symbiobacter mobilis]AGX87454.1 O-antigen polymerase [Candidatus Symbiobacter mobilis CR]